MQRDKYRGHFCDELWIVNVSLSLGQQKISLTMQMYVCISLATILPSSDNVYSSLVKCMIVWLET